MATYVKFPEPVGYLKFSEDTQKVSRFLLDAIADSALAVLPLEELGTVFIVNTANLDALAVSRDIPADTPFREVTLEMFQLEYPVPVVVAG